MGLSYKLFGPYNWCHLWEQVMKNLFWVLMANVGQDRRSQLAPRGKTILLIWNIGETGNIPQVLWWNLITLNVLSGIVPSLGVMFHMIRRHWSCNGKLIICVGSWGVEGVIGAYLPHQVRAQGEAMIAQTSVGLELHLVSPTQLLHSRISLRRATTNVKEGPFHHTMGNDAMSKALW